MVDIVSSVLLVALGFAPTLGALEMAWRMGRAIARRGEAPRIVA